MAASPDPNGETPSDIKKWIGEWVNEARHILFKLGSHVKKMVQEAQHLTVAAAGSRASIQTLAETGKMMRDLVQQLEGHLGDKPNIEAARDHLQELKMLAEKITLDTDAAFHAYEGVFQSTQDMNDSITLTTEALMQEAKLMQNLQSRSGDLKTS